MRLNAFQKNTCVAKYGLPIHGIKINAFQKNTCVAKYGLPIHGINMTPYPLVIINIVHNKIRAHKLCCNDIQYMLFLT